MKARASLSIFKRFGLSSIISDFLISLFAFFVGMFVTVAASWLRGETRMGPASRSPI